MLVGMRVVLALVLLLAACGGDNADPVARPSGTGEPAAPPTSEPTTDGCADVVAVEVAQSGEGLFTFHVTVSSADEGWDKYADEWVVRGAGDTVLGTRVLTHPHVDEQPFTRSLSGVAVPDELTTVIVAARDSVAGYCGASVEVPIP